MKAHGSSYRRPGARMLIAADGSAVGSLSGGCLEEEVVERARGVIRTGEPEWMEFDTRHRFGCHGSIEVFIERACPAFLADLTERIRARRSFDNATIFSRGAADGGSRLIEQPDHSSPDTFVQRIDPPLQLLVGGDCFIPLWASRRGVFGDGAGGRARWRDGSCSSRSMPQHAHGWIGLMLDAATCLASRMISSPSRRPSMNLGGMPRRPT